MDLIDFGLGVLSNLVSVPIAYYAGRPLGCRVKVLGFSSTHFNPGGRLHKLRFELTGRKDPGDSRLRIEWLGGPETFAKWDERPNPLDDDRMDQFRASKVPETYYQPLFPCQQYNVPIIWEHDGQLEVFCGWSFDLLRRYGKRDVTEETVLKLTLRGEGLNWSKSFPVWKITGRGVPPATLAAQ